MEKDEYHIESLAKMRFKKFRILLKTTNASCIL